jgi:hypothetical protein
VQPGSEGAAPVEAAERAQRREERLLGDVLRRGRVTHDQIGRAVSVRPVAPEELLDSELGAVLGGLDQHPLGGALHARFLEIGQRPHPVLRMREPERSRDF